MSTDRLSLRQKFSYGVGHVLNDLSASMWFSYLLIYLHRVVGIQSNLAGYMMLIGQVADGFSTVFVGVESDRTNGFFNYGQRKSWHLVGVIAVLMSFPFMFNLCIGCENTVQWALFVYYVPFIVIFQFGWASTQISHLSLIPSLTSIGTERVSLNAIRYAFTVTSNLFVYACAFFLFKYLEHDKSADDLGRGDANVFMYLAFIVIVVGLIFTLIFHLGTKEVSDIPSNTEAINSENNSSNDDESNDTQSIQNIPLCTYSTRKKLDLVGYFKYSRFYTVLFHFCIQINHESES
jgi:Na+/melibiose symporter-like transporter